MPRQNSGERIVFNRAQGGFLTAVILLVMLLLVSAGCAGKADTEKNDPQKPLISAKPRQQTEVVKLYFSDKQAMYLKPEVREITTQGEPLGEAVIKELIKGPQEEGLIRTIPEETKLLSFQVNDGVAYVNFSKEIKTKHWGGTTGEYMTIYSVINTLADLGAGIKKVQFLLEGEKEETLVGHLGTFEPLEPDWSRVASGEISVGGVEVNTAKMEEIQLKVDSGQLTWYLDPLKVAEEKGAKFGFDPRKDKFELVKVIPGKENGAGTGLAEVKAVHNDEEYIIQLIQPVKQGKEGIWAINSIRPLK